VNGTGRANANAGLNNAAARANVNGQGDFISQTPFFTDPGVRQQLNLNDTQFNTLNRNYQMALARYNEAVNRLSPGLTPEQRDLQLQRLQQQFNQSLAGTANSTLTNPQTLNRFNQLNRQFMGFNAFNDPTIRQQLNLTPDQLRQLRTVQNNFRQQLQQFRRGAGNDLSAVDTTQFNPVWQQYVASLNSVLTPEQQQMWMQLVGQPHTFSPNLFNVERLPQENVVTPPAVPFASGNQRNAAGGTTTPGATAQGTTTQGTTTQGTAGTQTPTGTQATQGTTTQGTTTQGGTVR